MTVGHPQWGLMCEICFSGLTPDECAVDADGQKWDVCRGKCAIESGVLTADQLQLLGFVKWAYENDKLSRYLVRVL